MALETANYISDLDAANPAGPDRLANGDDHIRMIKAVLKGTFPAIDGAVTATKEQLNALGGSAIPFGIISLWYGSSLTVPGGYAICDGSTVAKTGGGTVTVPDLRDRVAMGASATHVQGTTSGQNSKVVTSAVGGGHTHNVTMAAGGAHDHTVTVAGTALSVAQMPSHNHGLKVFNRGDTDTAAGSAGSGDETLSTGSSYIDGFIESEGSGATHTHTASTAAGSGTHSHTATAAAVADHSHQVTVDVTQASLALHYIMKV